MFKNLDPLSMGFMLADSVAIEYLFNECRRFWQEFGRSFGKGPLAEILNIRH